MTPTLATITAAASAASGITVARILGPERTSEVVNPRFAAIHLAKAMTSKSLPEIGRHFRRDHTSVLHAVRRAEDLLHTDPDFVLLVQRAQTACQTPEALATDPLRLAVIDHIGRCNPVLVQAVARFLGVTEREQA